MWKKLALGLLLFSPMTYIARALENTDKSIPKDELLPVIFSKNYQNQLYTLYSVDFEELFKSRSGKFICDFGEKQLDKNCLIVKVEMYDGSARFYPYRDFFVAVYDQKDGVFRLPLEYDIYKYCNIPRSRSIR